MAIQAQLYQDNFGFPLCGSQDWMIDNNGCGGGFNQFSLNVHQKQQEQQQHQQQLLFQELRNQQQRDQNLCLDIKNDTCVPVSMTFPQTIAAQDEKHRHEIDQYIKLQNEKLKLVIQEQRKQQLRTILKKIESKVLVLLRQKDEEIAQAGKRALELEDFLRKLELENQTWQRLAQENEAMVVSLNNTLEQVRETCCVNNGAEDAESCCDIDCREEDDEVGTGENRGMMMICKACNSRSSCMLFLPCRHLCSCKLCEPFLDSCPVCETAKKASIEALIF